MMIIKKAKDMTDIDKVEINVAFKFIIEELKKIQEGGKDYLLFLTTRGDDNVVAVKVCGVNSNPYMLFSTYRRMSDLVDIAVKDALKEDGINDVSKEFLDQAKRKLLDVVKGESSD